MGKWKDVEYVREYHRKWYAKHKHRPEVSNRGTTSGNRRRQVKYAYGLTWEEYESLWISGNGCCHICNTPLALEKHDEIPTAHVDHCHTIGKVRGILCNVCNTGLGSFKDSIDMLKKATQYLEKSTNGT